MKENVSRPSMAATPENRVFRFAWEAIRWPGLTPDLDTIGRLRAVLPKKWAVRAYKRETGCAWILLVGGTGTGKSTLFNAICGRELSETGVERPKTQGPVAYVHRDRPIHLNFPFADMGFRVIGLESQARPPFQGNPGELLCVEHDNGELSRVVLVDTPDVDSLEIKNRRTVEDLYLLADSLVFVASEEKYADDVPFQFLRRIHEEGKRCLVVVNKVGAVLRREEVHEALEAQGVFVPRERFWILPFAPLRPGDAVPESPAFQDLLSSLRNELHPDTAADLLRAEATRAERELVEETRRLLELLAAEDAAGRRWLEHLDVFFKSACRALLDQQERHLTREHREAIQKEIRKLYSRYDLLGKPRRAIAQAIRMPLQALGLVGEVREESHREALLRIRERIDLGPIQAAVDGFNRAVLEKLTPQDPRAPLAEKLRQPDLVLSRDAIRQIVWEEQERLATWLETTFDQLAQGIPKSKEWGIYSTSVLWGGLILALETAIGGGITILEAVLDSAIAPFVTRGAVELFVYHELQRIARELGERYRDGLVAVLRRQRDCYVECLESLLTAREAMSELSSMSRQVAR